MIDLALGTAVAWFIAAGIPVMAIYLIVQAVGLVRQAQKGEEL